MSDKRYKITLTENQLALVGTAVGNAVPAACHGSRE